MPSPSSTISAQADRWLAVAAYLGMFVGLWLIAPLAVYLLRRRHSRFVAFHAAQAALLHLLFGLLLTVCAVLAAILGVLVLLLLDARSSPMGVECLLALGWGSWLVPTTIHIGLTVIAARLAYRGAIDPDSRPGRVTTWLIGHDPGLPPADG